MLADFSAEKQRLQDALHNAELASERRRHALDEERKDAVAAVQAELSVRMSAVEKKHQTELQSLQQQYEADFKIWRREHETAAKLRETERENCLRREAHLERDRQIDGIVAKLDAENLKKEQELDHKLRFESYAVICEYYYLNMEFLHNGSRLQDKHTHELQQLELAESTARDKYADCRTKLAESEAAREIAQVTAKQYEMQLQHIQQVIACLSVVSYVFINNNIYVYIYIFSCTTASLASATRSKSQPVATCSWNWSHCAKSATPKSSEYTHASSRRSSAKTPPSRCCTKRTPLSRSAA